jgi:Tfp pilus assembly protein PilF
MQAIELDPFYVDAYLSLGIAHVSLGDYESAIEAYTAGIEVTSSSTRRADLFIERGYAYMLRERYYSAQDDYDRAIAFAPENARAWSGRGYVRLQINDIQGAFDDYDRALELGTDNPVQVHFGRGYAALKLRDYETALADFDAALELSPDDPSLLPNRAEALRGLGRYDEAIAIFQSLLANGSPFQAYALRGLAVAQFLNGDLEAAEDATRGFLYSTLICCNLETTQPLAPGDTQIVEIGGATAVRVPFDAQAGAVYRIHAKSAAIGATEEFPEVDPFLILLDPDGGVITFNADADIGGGISAWNSVIEFTAEVSGEYRVIVLDESGVGRVSEVDVSLGEVQ